MSTRKALKLLPPCATTGIGSLPHTQQELALQAALLHDVPFLPQLPSKDPAELMIPAALDGLPGVAWDKEGLCTVDVDAWHKKRDRVTMEVEGALQSGQLGAFEPSVTACCAFRPFLWEVEHRKLPFAKVQIAGPATVRWVARTAEGKPVSDHPELDQQVFRLLLAKSLALVKAVRRAGATPILYLDEPGLFALERHNLRHVMVLQELKMLIVAAQREGALVGLHCCSNTDWRAVLELGLDVVSIDARLSLDAVLEEGDLWLRFLTEGSTLSLGIVPTDLASSYVLDELVESVEASLRATTPHSIPFEALLAGMLLTPACGLGMRTVKDAEQIVEEVRLAQRKLRLVGAAEAAASP